MAAVWDSEESARRWDRFVPEWVPRVGESGDRCREAIITPALLAQLGDVRGKRVLDAGCGEGYLSRLLAKRGASVTGLDYSQAMLDVARERTPGDLGIRYVHGTAERLDGLADASFDVVVSNVVLIDLADYGAAIREAYRVLVSDGVFVFVNSHPCFATPGSGWERDENGAKVRFYVDRYYEEGPREERIYANSPNVMLQFHRTLTSYVRALLAAGFRIADLDEPRPTAEGIAKEPSFADELRRPLFLVIRAEKPIDSGEAHAEDR